MEPLKEWICDNCGRIISSIDSAYVIWKSTNGFYHDFRIIHQSICDNNRDYPCSAELNDFLGVKGVNELLIMLSLGPVKHNLGQLSEPMVNLDDFTDFFRRCQLPYYEEARQYFNKHDVLERFSDGNELTPYTESALKEIITMGKCYQ